jgi:CheY-like chemotaxis protein
VQVDQILANLVVNSRDAIFEVGRITIETGEEEFDEALCLDRPGFLPGRYLVLTVNDNGSGIDAENLPLLFDPFFTTKEVGRGTGLGLATVYGIVKQNNGFIDVNSERGVGTTFRIYLPVHLSDASTIAPTPESADRPTGSETVLLVEDEPSLLKLTGEMLEELGYTVLPAGTPGMALQLTSHYQGEIHILITDVIMPEMNGRALADALRQIAPNLKCLFMSGYTADFVAHQGVLEQGLAFLQKPFTRNELAVALRELLEE